MSKRMKVLVSVLVAVLLLIASGTAIAMAQEEEEPEPAVASNGLLTRVAEILGISEEDLANAFQQARQETREEAYFSFLDKAVAEGRLTQEEAGEIEEWWQQKPESLEQGLLRHACGFKAMRGEQMPGNRLGVRAKIGSQPWQEMNQQAWRGAGQKLGQKMRLRVHQGVDGELQQLGLPWLAE